MTKRRSTYDGKKFTPEVIDVYQRARQLYDEASDHEALKQTQFGQLQDELNKMLGRTAPWLHEVFDTADEDAPPAWMTNQERAERWHDAKKTLSALEQAARPRR